MVKSVLVKGALAALPLIAVAFAFFYVASRLGVPETYLAYIKPALYGLFAISSVGLPTYLCLADERPISSSARTVIGMIAVMWGVFSLALTLMGFTVFPGLSKDLEPTPLNMAFSLIACFVAGFVLLSLLCTLIATLIRSLLFHRRGAT
ncbi:MAG: hypothetical protein C4532_19355 [Candidatus Abyssobacteria bacterium SURF_17]|uniref:Uncharacterized protein n=1 Tax=Candidatus Abyssobacteria bacterium SURF_17 TaxID=2093361 RepID=A0A419ENL6_9BACT|nr:MAG: hypothetical protein C4532_19355 [Candidatus Abyssubacteria bacterium SURF_17]